jgi:virulence factor Mce-like protein
MRRILAVVAVLLAAGAFVVVGGAASSASGSDPSYKVELDNSFGLVNGEQFKVAGVPAGTISSLDLCYTDPRAHCQNPMHALVTVQVTQSGFGSFHANAFCESRPQSLIGEYFLNCDPGNSGPLLAPGSTINVTHTQSTIPGDLLQDIMRMPYRERFTLIINELGAAVAGNSQNLQAALDRAVPALTQTDNLLNLLANDSHTLQDLTATSNSLVTALANNSGQVQRFIDQSANIATETATQQAALKGTFHDLPGLLEQLRPALQKLGAATDANLPVLNNLNASASQLDRFLTDLPPFANSARPALKSLGQASVTGKSAINAVAPPSCVNGLTLTCGTIHDLQQFAGPANCSGRVFNCTPELAQNLAIVLHDLDDRSRAVEADPRSPGGQGYTGFEALLQYVFNQVLAIDYFGPFGHWLALDLQLDSMCSPYATPGTIASNLGMNGASYRHCYDWLGPNQPGVNETDPSNPSGCVPDPGGEPPYAPAGAHPTVSVGCKLAAVRHASTLSTAKSTRKGASARGAGSGAALPPSASNLPSSAGALAPPGLRQTLTQLVSALGSSLSSQGSRHSGTAVSNQHTTSSPSGSAPAPNEAQQLLNYLLSP